MNKPIIVDGVDVSECAFFHNMLYGEPATICSCFKDMYGCDTDCSLNINAKNCYYKQLQRLKAENEELKRINTILELVTEPQRQEIEKYLDKALKFKKALEEIKEIANEPCLDDEDCETCDENCMSKDIINKINEVLEDEI